ELAGVPGVRLAVHGSDELSNFQYVGIEVEETEFGIHRDVMLEVLTAENILARRYFYPGLHRMEPYRTSQPGVGARLPATEALAQRVLVLPTGTAVSPSDITQICELIRFCRTAAPELSTRLPRERLVVARDLR